jgi:hypothetical protein
VARGNAHHVIPGRGAGAEAGPASAGVFSAGHPSPPDILLPASIGRQAFLERVAIDTVPSARTLWIGADGTRVFVVLDPDVKLSHEARVVEGGRVTLIGLVRRAPAADTAMRQWALDAGTAQTVEQGGTYLHVTEVRP